MQERLASRGGLAVHAIVAYVDAPIGTCAAAARAWDEMCTVISASVTTEAGDPTTELEVEVSLICHSWGG